MWGNIHIDFRLSHQTMEQSGARKRCWFSISWPWWFLTNATIIRLNPGADMFYTLYIKLPWSNRCRYTNTHKYFYVSAYLYALYIRPYIVNWNKTQRNRKIYFVSNSQLHIFEYYLMFNYIYKIQNLITALVSFPARVTMNVCKTFC